MVKDQGKLDESLACYRRALELKPDLAEAHNNLGSVWRRWAIFRRGRPFRAALRHDSRLCLPHITIWRSSWAANSQRKIWLRRVAELLPPASKGT